MYMSSSLHTKKALCPIDDYSRPIAISSHEFIVASNAWSHSAETGIYKYDTDTDEWSLMYKYPAQTSSMNHSIAINDNHTAIYMHNSQCRVMKIDLKTGELTQSPETPYKGSFGCSLCINDKYHSFGGWNHHRHLIFDEDTQSFETEHNYMHFDSRLIRHCAVHLKQKDIVLIIGGKDDKNKSDAIYSYDIKTRKTVKLDTTLPIPMAYMAFLVTADERYGIVIGGQTDDKALDDIYVLDLKLMQWTTSKVKYAETRATGCNAVILGNIDKRDLLVSAFVRQECAQSMNKIPIELLDMICSFYSVEMVHLMDTDSKHVAISVHDILECE